MFSIKDSKFYVDALTTDTKELLQSLLSKEFLTHHIETVLLNYELDFFSDEEISTIIFLALNDNCIDLASMDFLVAKIGEDETSRLAHDIYKIEEEELITFFLTKPTITLDESDTLKSYHDLVSHDVNYYYITEKIDGGSCRKIIDNFLKSLNPYTRKYLFEYIAFAIREEEMKLKETTYAQ